MSAPNAAATSRDPSRSSYYVGDALYRDLKAHFSDWQDDARAIADPAIRDEFRRLLEREARLLDQLRYDDWLGMYAAECIYWVPSTPQAGDPRREISVMFDDRRRLEDRVIACAPALPGRRRRPRAPCGSSPMSKYSAQPRPTCGWCGRIF